MVHKASGLRPVTVHIPNQRSNVKTTTYCRLYANNILQAYKAGVEEEAPNRAEPLCRSGAATIHERRDCIRASILHAWRGYRTMARGFDEVRPISGAVVNHWGAAATLFDSLDTLWLAGLRQEFQDALQYLQDFGVPMPLWPTKTFEYSIRMVGGLLAAHSLSGEPILLDAARSS